MMTETTDDYDWGTLAARAEDGSLPPVEGTVLRGQAAADGGRAALLAATGSDTLEEATRVALGRPRLGGTGEVNVTWKIRAPQALDQIVDQLAQRQGKTRSALIRDAVTEYARTHAAA